jgi:hypothetical protein
MTIGRQIMEFRLSRHASQRLQQRAIPGLVVTLIHDHGSSTHSSEGTEVLFVDKAARKRIRQAVGGDRVYSLLERWLDSYLVLSAEGAIITAGHRHRRIKRR